MYRSGWPNSAKKPARRCRFVFGVGVGVVREYTVRYLAAMGKYGGEKRTFGQGWFK